MSRTNEPSRATVDLSTAQHNAIRSLLRVAPVADELGRRVEECGGSLALVGGSVRDALLDRLGTDLDFTTSLRPAGIERAVAGWADHTWDLGRRFGTIGCRKDDAQIEITTYRSDEYDGETRKPVVAFGDSLEGDLARRDFTVNAMAVSVPEHTFIDPFNGVEDIAAGVLRTPVEAEVSFGDDPLRMLRAARFVSQLRFRPHESVVAAMRAMAERIEIVSAERVRDELVKLLLGKDPRAGLTLLVDTGLAEHVLPEVPALRLERDEHHRHKDVYEHSLIVLEQAIDLEHRLDDPPDLTIRLAALLHDIGKPRTRRFQSDGSVTFHHHDVVGAKLTRKRMRALRFPGDLTEDVAKLVELHLRFHGYGSGEWTDSAVRRYVRDAGDQLERLHVLTRADCTTRNKRKAQRLQRVYDDLEKRIERLEAEEELAAIRPELDGNQIMEVLEIGPGPEIGQAYRFLLDLRMERGPIGEDAAREALLSWWAEQG